MKIAVAMTHFGIGGMERFTLTLAEKLKPHGHEFYFLNLRDDHFQDRFRNSGITLHLSDDDEIRRFLKEEKIDIVQVSNNERMPRLAFEAGVAGIVERTDGYSTAFHFDKSFLDAIVCSTRAMHEEMVIRYPDRENRLIYNGVDTEMEFRPDRYYRNTARGALDLEEEDLVLGFAGRLAPEKCLDLLLKWFAGIRNGLPEARLVILGREWPHKGAVLPDLKRLARKLGIANDVRFADGTEYPATVLRAFDVGVLTSGHYIQKIGGTPTSVVEGISNSVLETMAMSCPVVATDSGDSREVVVNGETGYLVNLGDGNAFVEKTRMLLEESDLRESLGARARSLVQKRFGMERMAGQYQELYELLVKRAGSGDPAGVRRSFLSRVLRWEQDAEASVEFDGGGPPAGKPAESAQEAGRILLVRSSRPAHMREALKTIHRGRPGSLVDLLSPPGVDDRVKGSAPTGVREVIRFGSKSGTFSRKNCPRSLRRALSEKGYDEVVVLMNNRDGSGYEKVLDLVRSFHAGEMRVYDAENRLRKAPESNGQSGWLGRALYRPGWRYPAALLAETSFLVRLTRRLVPWRSYAPARRGDIT